MPQLLFKCIIVTMEKDEKKRLKAQAKIEKKQAKARQKQLEENQKTDTTPPPPTVPPPDDQPVPPAPATSSPNESVPLPPPAPSAKPSPAVRFAEAVRGVIYLVFAVSLVLALVLGEKDVLFSLDRIIENLLVIRAGQIVLIVIAGALFIYGLKHLRLIK